jgi:hypothetical protein
VTRVMQFAPPCEKCVYFVPGKYSHTGTCRRFIAYRGRGKLVYDFSDTVRLDTNKCGPNGRLFISKDWKRLLEDEE